MAPNVLMAQVIAHESGHKFGLRHPTRANCCTFIQTDEQNAATTVTMSLFGMPQTLSKTLYIFYEGYWDEVLTGWQKPDRFATTESGVEVATTTLIPPRDSIGTALHRLSLNKKLPSTSIVWIQNQESRIMDWTPRTTKRTYADWDFSDADKSRVCVHTNCYQ